MAHRSSKGMIAEKFNLFVRLKGLPLCIMIALVMMLMAGCSGSSDSEQGNTSVPDPVVGENYYLDTICTISIYELQDADGNAAAASGSDEAAEAANASIDEAFELCRDLESKISRTIESSDVSRINSAGGEWVSVSEDTIEIIQKGMEYSHVADGAFDITVGGLTEQWDFHADEGEAKLPDEDALAEAAEHVNYRNLAIEGNKVRLTDPETKLDLGGIAKGWIGDRMTEVLEAEGVTSAIINLGGNVICIGGKTDTDDFVIGVETPFSDRTEIIGKINARDMTLVTSGVYERYIEVDGKKYHHILDTKTGWPAETDLDAVTLIGAKGQSGDLDALSTTCLIKGSAEAKEFIESMDGIEGVFVLSDGSVLTTDGAGFVPVE